MATGYSRKELLQLYKQLLRSAETFPSKNRLKIYQAIREEWKEYIACTDETKLQRQISVAYKGLDQLRQYDVETMAAASGSKSIHSPNWTVNLEQNPMPKPSDYDERKSKTK